MIYVDSNVFIFAFLGEQRLADSSRRILRQIARNQINAFTSALTWDEIVWSARKYLGPEDAVRQGAKFLEFPHLNLVEASELVLRTAQDLLSRYNLKPRDAIHAASAVSKGLKAIVSDDHDFDVVQELRRTKITSFRTE